MYWNFFWDRISARDDNKPRFDPPSPLLAAPIANTFLRAWYYITLVPNLATLKVIVTIAHSDYKVDIANSSLRMVLGWPAVSPILTEGPPLRPTSFKSQMLMKF